MRKRILFLLSVAAISAPLPIQADESDLFATLDANKDGFVAKNEVPAERQRFFERLVRNNDKNDDGKLSREEFNDKAEEPARTPAPGGREGREFDPAEVFKRLDRDGDGKITKEEAPERMKENFARIDANGDGKIDLAEFREVAARLGGRTPARPGVDPTRAGGAAPLIRALDADGNGELSAEEIANSPKVLLKLDRNGDGQLTRDELPSAPAGGPQDPRAMAEQMLRRLKAADTNGDGKIQKDEAPPRIAAMFDRLDTDDNGVLDEAELRVALEKLGQRQREKGDESRQRSKPRE